MSEFSKIPLQDAGGVVTDDLFGYQHSVEVWEHLDWDEAMRIRFAKQYFAAAPVGPVDYINTTDKEGLRVSVELEGRSS